MNQHGSILHPLRWALRLQDRRRIDDQNTWPLFPLGRAGAWPEGTVDDASAFAFQLS